jgi:hypothetical protein
VQQQFQSLEQGRPPESFQPEQQQREFHLLELQQLEFRLWEPQQRVLHLCELQQREFQ